MHALCSLHGALQERLPCAIAATVAGECPLACSSLLTSLWSVRGVACRGSYSSLLMRGRSLAWQRHSGVVVHERRQEEALAVPYDTQRRLHSSHRDACSQLVMLGGCRCGLCSGAIATTATCSAPRTSTRHLSDPALWSTDRSLGCEVPDGRWGGRCLEYGDFGEDVTGTVQAPITQCISTQCTSTQRTSLRRHRSRSVCVCVHGSFIEWSCSQSPTCADVVHRAGAPRPVGRDPVVGGQCPRSVRVLPLRLLSCM